MTSWSISRSSVRSDLDANAVERAIRPVALSRRNALFAGSDRGAEHGAIIASLVGTARLDRIEPLAWLADVPERRVAGGAGVEPHRDWRGAGGRLVAGRRPCHAICVMPRGADAA